MAVRVPVAPDGVLVRPREEPSGQVEPPSQERSSQISSPAPPDSMLAQAIAFRWTTCSRIVRPYKAVEGTGCSSPAAWPALVPSPSVSQTGGEVQLGEPT